jgi:hypothetical protein
MKSLLIDIYHIIRELFVILIPLIVVIKLLEELGAITWLSYLVSPLVGLVGLPGEMGIVWATAMLTNLYGGMVAFVSLSEGQSWSVAQVSVLALMMLSSHNLIVELRIAQKLGLRLFYLIALRIGFAMLSAASIYLITEQFEFMNQPAQINWQPELADDTWLAWLSSQLTVLAQVALIVAALVVLLRILKWTGIERFLENLFKPVLAAIGLNKDMASFTLIGMLLGLAYGGGLLIREAQKRVISARELFISVSLLSVCHSLIEDTILMLLIGADLMVILPIRAILSFAFIYILVRLVSRLPSNQFEKYLCTSLHK